MKRITCKTCLSFFALGIVAWPVALVGQTDQPTTPEKPFTHIPGQTQFQYNPYRPTVDPRFNGYAYDYLHFVPREVRQDVVTSNYGYSGYATQYNSYGELPANYHPYVQRAPAYRAPAPYLNYGPYYPRKPSVSVVIKKPSPIGAN